MSEKNRDNGIAVESFADLKTALAQVPLLDLPEMDLDADGLEAQAVKIREKAGQARDWVTTILPRLDQVQGASREAQELVAEQIAEAKQRLEDLLSSKFPAIRRGSWTALLMHKFSVEMHTRKEFKTLLDKLVQDGFLTEDQEGPLEALKRHFAVSTTAAFGAEEIAEVKSALDGLSRRVWETIKQARTHKAKVLTQRATIICQELQEGKKGICSLSIPAEKYERDGVDLWRPGGTLLVQSNGEKIFAVDCSGAIEGAVRDMAAMRIHLFVVSLSKKYPPSVHNAQPEYTRRVKHLWHLINRGLRAKETEERTRAKAEELACRATVTQEEFFLAQKAGICLAKFDGVWRQEGVAPIHSLFFLVERNSEGERIMIRVVDIPTHLAEFLEAYRNEEYAEGEDYRTVSNPLGAILRAIAGQFDRAAPRTSV